MIQVCACSAQATLYAFCLYPRGNDVPVMREVTIICRECSKNGLPYYRRLLDELPRRDVRITEAHVVRTRKQLAKAIRRAIKAQAQYIVVVGGDGTQTAAVAELAHSDSTLCVVPAGTGNSFALGLGIPNDVEKAIDTIAAGKETCIDVGCVNGTYFANFATVGTLAVAADRTPKPLKRIIGPVAYVLGFIPALRRRAFHLRAKYDGGNLTLQTHQIILAAGRYYGWEPLTPSAGVQSGDLAFFGSEGRTAADVIKTNAALLLGKQTDLAGAHFFSSTKIKIKCKPQQPISLDGHLYGKTPATFTVARNALRVLVPQDFEKRE